MTSIQFRRQPSCSHTHSCFRNKLYVLAWSGQINYSTTRPAEFCACCGARKGKDTKRNNRPIASTAIGLAGYALRYNDVVDHSSGRQADRYTGPTLGVWIDHALARRERREMLRCVVSKKGTRKYRPQANFCRDERPADREGQRT